MSESRASGLTLNHRFDSDQCRHIVNGRTVVLHCHHYATLYCQLAKDCGMLDGGSLLAECAEDTFLNVLSSYFADQGVDSPGERLALAEEYHATTGLGQMTVVCAGIDAGVVHMAHSHIDDGWKKKWGAADGPVNFIGQGFVAASFAAAYDLPCRSYIVSERASIATGAERSVFEVARR